MFQFLFVLSFGNFSFQGGLQSFLILGAGVCIGDTCFWSFIVQSECFSFFLRFPLRLMGSFRFGMSAAGPADVRGRIGVSFWL